MRSELMLCLIGVMVTSTAVCGQEQGRPPGMPPSRELAEQFLSGQNTDALFYLASACPEASEWNRNLVSRILQDGRRTADLIALGPAFFDRILETCGPFPALNAWYRESLLQARTTSVARPLLSGILDTWQPTDRDLIFQYVQRSEVDDDARTLALQSAARKLPGPARVDWFFDVFEAGVLTEHYFRTEQGVLNQGVTAEAFASRGARSVPAHATMPLAPLVMETVAHTVAVDTAVSSSTAAAVLRGLDQLVGRPEFSAALSYRAAVARAAGGTQDAKVVEVIDKAKEYLGIAIDMQQPHNWVGNNYSNVLIAAWNANQMKVDSVYVHDAPQGSQTKSAPQYCLMKY